MAAKMRPSVIHIDLHTIQETTREVKHFLSLMLFTKAFSLSKLTDCGNITLACG